MKKQLISVTLAALLLTAPMTSCSKAAQNEHTATDVNNSSDVLSITTTISSEVSTEPPLPTTGEILGFEIEDNRNKVFTILSNSTKIYEFGTDTQTGDVVGDAVYLRNTIIEEYLGIDLNIILEDGNYASRSAFNALIERAVNAGESSYDLVNNTIVSTLPAANKGIFVEGNQLTYTQFNKSWWINDMYDRFSVMGKLYGFLGDVSLSIYKDMSVIFFNQDIWMQKQPNIDLYELVRKGEWTLDKFIELTSDMAEDLNGDGV